MLPTLSEVITTTGYLGISAIVFAESGLFFGFFLPGDSLLVTAGLLASQDIFDIKVLLLVLPLMAILGDQIGYWTGERFGVKIFNKKHINRAQKFYARHGNKTIFLARFVPIIRTFAPIAAGIGKMDYKSFVIYNIAGGIFWTFSMLLLGFFLGNVIPDVDKYLIPIIIVIVIASLIPSYFEKRKK